MESSKASGVGWSESLKSIDMVVKSGKALFPREIFPIREET
jgi:hypothetical protein